MLAVKDRGDLLLPIRTRAADLVQEAILKGHLRPGDEVPQLKLARQLGLSQSSVREALQELEHRGLIEKRGRSRVITQLSEDDLGDLYQVRAALEPLACRLAAYHYRQSWGEQLEACLERMAIAGEARDYPEHWRADMEFHQLIWRCQPNRILENHLTTLCAPLFSYDLVERSDTANLDFKRSLNQHRLILSVLRARDGDRAELATRRLIHRFHKQDILDFTRVQRGHEVHPQEVRSMEEE